MAKYTEWIAPAFLVVAILAIWLALQYLPLASFGVTIDTDKLWRYMPWVVAFSVGLYVLKQLWRRH